MMKKRRRCPTCGDALPRRRKKFCDVWCQRNVNAIAEPEPPSPEEIEQRAAAIRQGWSTRQRRQAGGIVEGWSPPAVTASVPEPR